MFSIPYFQCLLNVVIEEFLCERATSRYKDIVVIYQLYSFNKITIFEI